MRRNLPFFLSLLIWIASEPAWSLMFSIRGLGDLPGGAFESQAADLNNAGQVVGRSVSLGPQGPRTEAFIWDSMNGMRGLGGLPGEPTNSVAFGINNEGEVVGNATKITGCGGGSCAEAFLWDSTNGMRGLGDLGGNRFGSGAAAITDATGVVGVANSESKKKAFLWTSDAGMIDLGDLPGGAVFSMAHDINNLGEVVGVSRSGQASPFVNRVEAFIWDSVNGMVGLGDLPGGEFESEAFGVNDQRQVVGRSRTNRGLEAFLWDETSGMVSLQPLSDSNVDDVAVDINNTGMAVGGGSCGTLRAMFFA